MSAMLILTVVGAGAAGVVLGSLWATGRERAKREVLLIEAERRRAAAEAQLEEMRRRLTAERELIESSESRLADSFRALAADALAANNEGFLTLAAEKLTAARREGDVAIEARQQAIEAMVKPVKESLDKVDGKIRDIERVRGEAYGQLTEMVRHMASTHERLRTETANLARALRAPAVRGRWGEIQLKRVVELAGMLEHCDFGQQETISAQSGRLRPDLVVRLPGARQVVVDAKVPLEAYLDAIEATNDDERRERMMTHAGQVRTHVLKLSGKGYWAELPSTPEFVVMFLPSEAMYSAALEHQPSLIEEGVARRVLIATPTTLIALLQSVHYGWRQDRLAENAQEISAQGRVLHERLATLLEHWSKLGGALGKATDHYNASVASLEGRVLPQVRRLEELGVSSKKATPELSHVDIRPRLVLENSRQLTVDSRQARDDDGDDGQAENSSDAVNC